ncbi:MAG: ABC transporter permease [Desulfurellales bacterium]|uniref:ABC transporter permease n=1 Tax=Pseudoxanthomonas mexicana TaxID=128785 RepID=UPI0011D3A0FA|nr:ABC transporter permease [Pseudoxanthomonas mexicana]TXH58548.1 MAG: ABC transporter permease [Desulfurellales bacterium]
MDPHAAQSASLSSLVSSLWRNRQLITQMAYREIIGRYQGSIFGLAWSFFHPMLLLCVYTFVFSVVFKARWGVAGEQSNSEYAIVMFVGLIIHGLFAEVLNRAPSLVMTNANYVKKVVFPLEILPLISLLAALFHSAISMIVLMAAFLIFNGYVHWTALYLPLVIAPIAILTVGLAWMLASLGVFIRDVGQTIGIVTMVMMFLAPVVYPITAVPESVRPWIMANPLTFIIEQGRSVLIWGNAPDWLGLLGYSCVALAVAWLGYFWFQKTRKGFADVL